MIPSFWRRFRPVMAERITRADFMNPGIRCALLGVRLPTLKSTRAWLGIVLVLCAPRVVSANQECWSYTI
jgi:hypothetical protein